MELYFESREEWHQWLMENHKTASEAWLVCYKKSSGKTRIPYHETVEEALCFGWIDGKIKSINKDYFIQRFTPRRKGSRWSKYNIERIEKLIKEGRMEPSGLESFREVLENPDLVYDNRSDGDPEMPDGLAEALVKNSLAFKNFQNFSPSVRRIYIEWLKSAKRQETRERRIEKIISLAEKNIRPGMM